MLMKRFRTCRRGKRAGALVKLRQRGFRTALPSIHLTNLCSLPNKTDQLLLLSQTNKDFFNFAALCFTETWLNDTIPDSTLSLPGFQLFRADRDAESMGKSRGGGRYFYKTGAGPPEGHYWTLAGSSSVCLQSKQVCGRCSQHGTALCSATSRQTRYLCEDPVCGSTSSVHTAKSSLSPYKSIPG